LTHPTANWRIDAISTPTLRWGILGCARIARRGLIPGIRASESGTLLALASRDRSRVQQWTDEFAVPRWYPSYEALLNDRDIDAVYIPLPNELHKPWVLAAADAGKHVLCEKPLALDAQEANAMVKHCQRCGVILMEGFMWRHQPRTREIQERVRDGAIGDVRLVRSSFSFPIEAGDWRLDPMRGGGALWDVGCYGVSTARMFAGGEPRVARALAHFGQTGVDMSLTAALEFESGVLATVDCSFEQPFRCHFELVGSHGLIEVPDAYLPPRAGPSKALLRSIGVASDSSSGGDVVQVLEFAPADQYAAMVDAFGRSVAAGALLDPAENGLAQMKMLDQLKQETRFVHGFERDH
jgi:predicted dehydrogenase